MSYTNPFIFAEVHWQRARFARKKGREGLAFFNGPPSASHRSRAHRAIRCYVSFVRDARSRRHFGTCHSIYLHPTNTASVLTNNIPAPTRGAISSNIKRTSRHLFPFYSSSPLIRGPLFSSYSFSPPGAPGYTVPGVLDLTLIRSFTLSSPISWIWRISSRTTQPSAKLRRQSRENSGHISWLLHFAGEIKFFLGTSEGQRGERRTARKSFDIEDPSCPRNTMSSDTKAIFYLRVCPVERELMDLSLRGPRRDSSG